MKPLVEDALWAVVAPILPRERGPGPKGVSMEDLTQADCDRIAAKINQRPRKRYDWHTPEELYAA